MNLPRRQVHVECDLDPKLTCNFLVNSVCCPTDIETSRSWQMLDADIGDRFGLSDNSLERPSPQSGQFSVAFLDDTVCRIDLSCREQFLACFFEPPGDRLPLRPVHLRLHQAALGDLTMHEVLLVLSGPLNRV